MITTAATVICPVKDKPASEQILAARAPALKAKR